MKKSPVDLSLFTKLWTVCLPETLWSRNLRWNFRQHVLADPYFTLVSTKIHDALKHTAPWRNTMLCNCNWEQTANGADNCCPQLTNHKQIPTHEPNCSPWNIMSSSDPQLLTSLYSKRYRPSGILIHRQNSYAPRSKRHTGRRETQSRGNGQQSKNPPCN
jgi:hypothetical protein